MHKPLVRKKLIVKPSPIHGYGVFAAQTIRSGEIIEECLTIPCSPSSQLSNYYFSSDEDDAVLMIALGNGSIYNHSDEPNAVFSVDQASAKLTIRAIQRIRKGDEIFIFYRTDWFCSRGMVPVASSPCTPHAIWSWLAILGRLAFVVGGIAAMFIAISRLSQFAQ